MISKSSRQYPKDQNTNNIVHNNQTMAITLCDSCKSTSASLYCKPDSAYLCIPCDNKIHAANKLASRHDRVWLCEVCERAPAYVTCKADNATLCVACDRDIHSANPLARRHERFPVASFTDPVNDHVSVVDVNGAGTEADEAEAALWLNKTEDEDIKVTRHETEPEVEMETKCFFNDVDPYVGLDLKTPDRKGERIVRGYNSQTDGVVPVQNTLSFTSDYVVEGLPAYDVDYAGSKPFMYNFTSQSISQSVSSSSLEVEAGVVPDKSGAMGDVTNNNIHQSSTPEVYPAPLLGLDREARVLRYREKKKNRKFEKTIRYASRKAYAEKRPRIKGRFAKRTEIDVEVDHAIVSPDSSYGVVPSY